MPETPVLSLRADGLSWKEIDGEVVVLDVEEAVYISLNPSGSRLWKRLATGATAEALIEELVDAFEVDRSTAAVDVDGFLEICRRHRLLG